MAQMTHRTTFALDGATTTRIRKLARRWSVSQAEVVRRAVAEAELRAAQPPPDPLHALKALHAKGRGMVREEAARYLEEVREDRGNWRGR